MMIRVRSDDGSVTTNPVGVRLLRQGLGLTNYYQLVVTDDLAALGEDWVRWSDLGRSEVLRCLVDAAELHYGGQTPVQRTAARGLAVGEVASVLAFALTGAMCLGGRAVRLDPAGIAFRHGGGGVEALAVTPAAVTVLAAGTHAEAATAIGYGELVAPLLGTAPLVRRGPRALAVDLADRLVTALFLNSQALGHDDAPIRARQLVAHLPDRMRHRVRLMQVPCDGVTVNWKRRAVCCLLYQTGRSAGELCITCPLLDEEESVERVAAWLPSISGRGASVAPEAATDAWITIAARPNAVTWPDQP